MQLHSWRVQGKSAEKPVLAGRYAKGAGRMVVISGKYLKYPAVFIVYLLKL